MKNLFVLDGASGTGKSDFLKYIKEFHQNSTILKKFSTRKKRDFEYDEDYELDIEFVNEKEFDELNLDYSYNYSGYRYGFKKSDLDESLKKFSNLFIIVRNSKLIKKIMADYRFINVVPVYIYTDKTEIVKRLIREGYDEAQVTFRKKRLKIAFADFLQHPELYKHILINNSSTEDYHRLIDHLIEKYDDFPDINDKLIFVLMSFNPDNENLPDYYRAMKRAVESFDKSYECINLDEMKGGSFKISDTAKKNLRNCRLAIVDLTDNSPNVFYELGFVHGISKDCIITAHTNTKKYFYPREYRTIYYNNATELEEKLSKHLVKILK